MKKTFSKITAFLLAMLMSIVVLSDGISSIKSEAVTIRTDITAPQSLSVKSEGAKWTTPFSYTDTVGTTHNIEAGDTFARLMVNGHNACCLMLGTQVHGGDTYIPNGDLSQIYNSFTDMQKKYLALAMAFGYPNTNSVNYYATQFIVWEITCGFRTCNSTFSTTKSLINCASLPTSVDTNAVVDKYNEIVRKIKAWETTPSSMSSDKNNPTSYKMEYNPTSNRWQYTITDTNSSFDDYTFTLTNSNYSIVKQTNNSLTIAAHKSVTASCSLTANKIIPAYESYIDKEGLVIWYREGKQALISGAEFDPISAYANFSVAGNASITLTKEFYSGTTKITSSNVAEITGATMADLFGKVRFIISTEIDGTTYYVSKETGSKGSYSFGGFATESTEFAVNSSGELSFTGLPKGYTYTITETETYSSDTASFKLAGDKTVTLSGDATTTVKNYLVPKRQTTQFYFEKNVLQADGAEYTDSTFLQDYYNNVSFYLYTFDDNGAKKYLKLTDNNPYEKGEFRGNIQIVNNQTIFNPNYLVSSRTDATVIDLNANGVVYFYDMPQFANGLYLEEIIGDKYIDGYYATNTYSVSTNGAVFELAAAGEYISSYYDIDNQQKTFRVVAYKKDTRI